MSELWRSKPTETGLRLSDFGGVCAQVLKRDEFKRAYVRRREDDGRCASSFKCLPPSGHAQTPAITAFEPGKVEFSNGRAKIVTGCGTGAKELLGHHCTYCVQAVITRSGSAVAIAIEAGARIETAAFEFAAQDVRRTSHVLILEQ